ncbi:MAG: pentapeptide repeat-containing protein [Acidaminobacteraceae bacterium]
MKKDIKKVLRASVPNALENVIAEEIEFVDELNLTCAHIKGGYIEEKNAKQVYFKECLFENITFSDINLDGLEIINCVFKSCDFSGVRSVESIVHKSEFIDCKMSGSVFSESMFYNVTFTNVIGNYFTARFSEFKNCFFDGCNLVSSDLQDSKFNKVYIEGCDLTSAIFLGVKLEGVDLTSNEIEGIAVRIEDVKGAKITTMQVLEFAKLLNVIIEE